VHPSSIITPPPLVSNISSQDHQNPGVQYQDSPQPQSGPYGNDPYSNLDLTDMANPEDSLMLLDNSWFFPMTNPSINPNISSWPLEMDPDSSGNVWDGNAFRGTEPLLVESQTKPNDEFIEMGYGNHEGQGTGYS
jgi:hypothetical protein